MSATSTDKTETFVDILSQMEKGAEAWSAPIPDSWRQGRTAYGGLSAALMLAAARCDHDPLPLLRSANIGFVGPVTANPVISTELLRQGRNVTAINTRLDVNDPDKGAFCAGTATFCFGAGRESSVAQSLPAPKAPRPNETESFFIKGAERFLPAFTRNFEVKLIDGGRPVVGPREGRIHCWARHRDPASWEGMNALLCLADVLPPAALPLMTTMAPVSSMTWLVNVLAKPETEDGWWQFENTQTVAKDGYSSQLMRVWNSTGNLVIEGMQSITIFA